VWRISNDPKLGAWVTENAKLRHRVHREKTKETADRVAHLDGKAKALISIQPHNAVCNVIRYKPSDTANILGGSENTGADGKGDFRNGRFRERRQANPRTFAFLRELGVQGSVSVFFGGTQEIRNGMVRLSAQIRHQKSRKRTPSYREQVDLDRFVPVFLSVKRSLRSVPYYTNVPHGLDFGRCGWSLIRLGQCGALPLPSITNLKVQFSRDVAITKLLNSSISRIRGRTKGPVSTR
jgi:hypothetical protein